MHTHNDKTELNIVSPLTRCALGWLYSSILVACLYAVRVMVEEIPPQDHLALSFILCFLLIQTWFRLDRTRLRISLPHNRCWLHHHHLGLTREQSLPVSQIHSARLEYSDLQKSTDTNYARIVLVTSLGMIPASLNYSDKAWKLDQTCSYINHFLESQRLLFKA